MIRPAFIVFFAVAGLAVAAAPRERISLNDRWRFAKGDPTNIPSQSLLYDVRPVARGEDQKERLAEATEDAAKLSVATNRVLKPWILPTANRFIKDPAKHFTRPDGNPGGEVAYVQNHFDDRGWRLVNLPHDWAIEGPFNSGGVGGGMGRLPSPGIGWYRRQLVIPASEAGKQIFLDVDGAMSHAAVWLNGKLVGGWPYGYASWRVDLTPFVKFGGENRLAIRLDNPPDFSRWYPGAGIYRNVWLTQTQPVHVGQWGTFVTAEVAPASRLSDSEKKHTFVTPVPLQATLKLQVTVDNDSQQPATVTVATEIFALGTDGKKSGAALATIAPVDLEISPGQSSVAESSVTITNPKLWGPPPTQQPNRYVAVTTVSGTPVSDPARTETKSTGRVGDRRSVVDVHETTFGIRNIECKPEGLFVNGERIRIQGVNQHHDLGALGAAFNMRAAERQLDILRDMGCNAIRMSHNPPAPELLELTDRMGFLVMDEIFDAWLRQKTPFDFHLIFAEWHEADVRAFIRRDRNHPSVFLWSVGNEGGEQYTGEDGAKVARELIALAHEEDPTRPATASMNFAKPDSAFAAAVDLIALNYPGEGIRDTPEFEGSKRLRTPPLYGKFREKFPDRMVVSSESAAAVSARGAYLFPVSTTFSASAKEGQGGDSKKQMVSAYELYAAEFGSSADKVFTAQDKNPFVSGEFVWSGWD